MPALLQLLEAQVAILDVCPVAAEADVSFVAFEAGVLVAVDRFRRARLLDVGIDDRLAVEYHLDLLAFGDDLFAIPLACRLEIARLRGDDAIHRAVMLPLLDPL